MIDTLSLGFEIEIVRTGRRKTAAIKILDGHVRVIVPNRLSDRRVSELIKRRRQWIRNKLHADSELPPKKLREYVSGESFTYLGKNYRLKVIDDTENDVKLKSGYLEVGVPRSTSKDDVPKWIRDSLVEWYRNHAETRLNEKVIRFRKILGVVPEKVVVKNYKARWGSCNSNGSIMFNWKIIIAPHSVVDYVVVHELSHLMRHDHSSEFWRHVSRVIPDYRIQRKWLQEHGHMLGV